MASIRRSSLQPFASSFGLAMALSSPCWPRPVVRPAPRHGHCAPLVAAAVAGVVHRAEAGASKRLRLAAKQSPVGVPQVPLLAEHSSTREVWQEVREAVKRARERCGKVKEQLVERSKSLRGSRRWKEVKKRWQNGSKWARGRWTCCWAWMRPRRRLLSLLLALLLLTALWPHPVQQVPGVVVEQASMQLLPAEEARLQMLQQVSSGVVYVKGQPAPWLSEKEQLGSFVPGGTAWVYDSKHVITSLRNVEQARQGSLQVVMPDRSELPARLVGSDPGSDLAVLELRGRTAFSETLALGAGVRLGQDVMILGREATLDMRISKGVVYATGQPLVLDTSQRVQSCIQTDALMTVANRGGPLVNSRGQVVAMALGDGQALPIESLRKHVVSVLAKGHVSRPSLGLFLAPDGFAEKLGLSQGGVVITEVLPGSPAAAAGLRPGDVLVKQGEQPIRRMDDLIQVLEPVVPGEDFTLTLLRPKKSLFSPAASGYMQLDLSVRAVESE